MAFLDTLRQLVPYGNYPQVAGAVQAAQKIAPGVSPAPNLADQANELSQLRNVINIIAQRLQQTGSNLAQNQYTIPTLMGIGGGLVGLPAGLAPVGATAGYGAGTAIQDIIGSNRMNLPEALGNAAFAGLAGGALQGLAGGQVQPNIPGQPGFDANKPVSSGQRPFEELQRQFEEAYSRRDWNLARNIANQIPDALVRNPLLNLLP